MNILTDAVDVLINNLFYNIGMFMSSVRGGG